MGVCDFEKFKAFLIYNTKRFYGEEPKEKEIKQVYWLYMMTSDKISALEVIQQWVHRLRYINVIRDFLNSNADISFDEGVP